MTPKEAEHEVSDAHDHADGQNADHSPSMSGEEAPDAYRYALSIYEKVGSGSAAEKVKTALLIDSIASVIENEKLSVSLMNNTEKLLLDALAEEPENKEALNNLAMIDIYRKEDVMSGVQKLLKVVKLDQNNEMALYQLGILAVKSGQTDKAIERFEKLVSLQPQNKEYHRNLALLYNQKGNTSKAEIHAAQAK